MRSRTSLDSAKDMMVSTRTQRGCIHSAWLTSSCSPPAVIHISSHSGVMESMWRATNHKQFKPATGAIVSVCMRGRAG